ncbi:DUF4365 domain-containing protein [Blastococcus saxobsidens]|uniref:DUF4365 domain-containing protein n=1 Tax=Blastococcus saxobsidens (strain DD2) TaxID=1146883 RepID=H6RLC9_BLASD|nr:DUF4365 domain-containing protein [Blastococcus saxobsidens]CCG02455.1 protein of unknown function; putative Carbamoyl phosphate synthetase domain [Blastococcus saxobsidens DD2]
MSRRRNADERKKLRIGHVSERGAVNAARALLERHGLVVDEVDGRSDYGRDLVVDITEDGALTGSVVGIQVKGDRRFIRADDWELPATPKDRRYWSESSVPVFGILWDPDSGRLRWANLTAYARTASRPGPEDIVRFPPSQALSDETLPALIQAANEHLRLWSPAAVLGLFDTNDEWRRNAVYDCWTLGRSDVRAFVLLRRALPGLRGESLRQAIITLSYLTPHPDIYWHSGNWIPPGIKQQARASFRWSAEELVHLVSAVEERPEETPGWERGGLGQCLWCLLVEDGELERVAAQAVGLAVARSELEVALRLLVIAQARADAPLDMVRQLIELNPRLRAHWYLTELVQDLEEFGFVDVY